MRTRYHNIKREIVNFFAIIACLLFFPIHEAKAVCNIQASFTYVEGMAHIIQFTNTTVGATSLHWDFGNGTTSTVSNPTIQFQQDAFYNVCLIVKDSNNCTDTICHSITIGAPCFHNNPTINHVVDITDSSSQICSSGGGNCFQDNFIILDSAHHGIVTQNGLTCFLYKPQSTGIDTIRVITCSLPILPENCDTTTHIINVIQREDCNQIPEDTVHLQLIKLLDGAYNLPVLYDSINNMPSSFVLTKFGINADSTIFPNRTFDSIVQLFRYIDSTQNGIFEFNGINRIYITSADFYNYVTGTGLEIFDNTTDTNYNIPFDYLQYNTTDVYCTSIINNACEIINDNPNPWSLYNCQSDNIGFAFYYEGINNITIIDSVNNCFENVVFVVDMYNHCEIIPEDTIYKSCNLSETVYLGGFPGYELPAYRAGYKLKLVEWKMNNSRSLFPNMLIRFNEELQDYMNINDNGNWGIVDETSTENKIVMSPVNDPWNDSFYVYKDSYLKFEEFDLAGNYKHTYYIQYDGVDNNELIQTLPIDFYDAIDTTKYSMFAINNLQIIYPRSKPTADGKVQFYLPHAYPGDSYITVNDVQGNCRDEVVINIDSFFCQPYSCVLPGDADHDLTVNNYDVLALGLSYNRTGNTRQISPMLIKNYFLQPCINWNTNHYYGYNDKFADCNGDGIINSGDASVIDQNYIVQEENHFNHRESNLDSLPAVTLVFDTLPTTVVTGNCDGAQIEAEIYVGSTTQPMINGYGVAFSVNYPFDNDSCFNVQIDLDPNSWLQTNDPVLLFYKNIPQYNRVDISVVRTDGAPRSGSGKIGKIKMITEGAVFRSGRLSSAPVFDFSVSNVAAVNNVGQKIEINGSETTVNFVVSGIKQNKVDGLKFYPNPTSGKIYINAKETIGSIKIIDTQGRSINEIYPNKSDVQLDISTIENGMYILEIKGNNTISYEKIFKQ